MTSTTLAQRLLATGGKGQCGPLKKEAAATITRLTEANKTLTAKAEAALADWSKAATSGIEDFKRAEAAEAKLAKVEAERDEARREFDRAESLSAELAEARKREERLRTAHEVMAKAVTDATHENDQPHRIIFKDGFVIEGRAAEEWHRLLRLLQRFSQDALSPEQKP
jgi:hypothetical protein